MDPPLRILRQPAWYKMAAEDARKQILLAAAEKMGIDPDDLDMLDIKSGYPQCRGGMEDESPHHFRKGLDGFKKERK